MQNTAEHYDNDGEDGDDADNESEAVTLENLTTVVRVVFGTTAGRLGEIVRASGAVGGTLIVAETRDGDLIEVGELLTDDPDWLLIVQNPAMTREVRNFVGGQLLRLFIAKHLARLGQLIYRLGGID
jgi:hypothetical protein